jgi:gliding motility-associated-like protein
MPFQTRSLRPAILVALCPWATAWGQIPTKCLEIESVLVDACNNSCSGASEGENEMFRFITGPAPIALSDLSATWATQNSFLGWVQNGTTAQKTAQLNATITNCGWLIEPPNGVIPAGKRVLGITSSNMCVTGNSFANLADTLYVIFQAPGNTMGHFKNHNNSGTVTTSPTGATSWRTFILWYGPTQCSDSARYSENQLVNQMGTYGGSSTQNDGSSLAVSWPGTPVVSYVNYGCQAPIIPLSATILTVPQPVACGASVALSGLATGNISHTFWHGGAGTFSTVTGNSTVYTLASSESNGAAVSFCAISVCGDTVCSQVAIPVLPPPVPVILNAPATVACGSAASFTGSVSGTAMSTFWSGGSGTWGAPSSLATTYTPGGSESGQVALSFCAVGSCGDTVCTQAVLSIAGAPTATISASGPTTICQGTSVTLTANGAPAIQWSTGAATPSITVTAAGTYTATVSNACGQGEASLDVSVALPPTAEASGPASACPGQSVALSASGGTGYLWNTGATTSDAMGSGPGAYTVVVSNACGSDQATVTVAPGEALAPAFTADVLDGCAPLCVRFVATGAQQAGYTWDFGDGGTAEGDSPVHCFAAGDHTVTLTATPETGSALCANSITEYDLIHARAVPVADFAMSPSVTTLEQPTIRFSDLSSGADSLLWDFGVDDSTSTWSNPEFTYDSVACYTVRLRVANRFGCIAEHASQVCIEDPFRLWVPNAFTPNGDGYNDTFFAVTSVANPARYKLGVFNRWGQMIFSGSTPREAWTADGAPNDVYVWKLWITDTLGKDHEASGHVTVVR